MCVTSYLSYNFIELQYLTRIIYFNLQDYVDDSVMSGRFGYRDMLGTPSESVLSLSPTSSSFLHSPSRSSFTIESPSPCGTSFSIETVSSPQGTTQDLQEFLQVSGHALLLQFLMCH